jgi:glycosyltransferase involved in cell wall biosynthesis
VAVEQKNAPVRIAIFATHPIQYQVPWFQRLARNPGLAMKVYFALVPDSRQQGVGFGVPFQWDIPMLAGYPYEVLPNAAAHPSLQGFFASRTPGLRALLERDRPDVAIITGWQAFPLLQALRACRALGIPAIVRAESNALRQRRTWVQWIHRALLSRYAAYLAIGKANRDFYLGYGIDPARIFDARYFVDNDRISAACDAARARRTELRARWGVPQESFCFVYAGKLVPKKRIFDLIDALALARERGTHAHLLVAGSGELEAQARARSAGMPVSFAGFLNQSELPSAYAAGDCLVLPSDFGETWGLVVNEAMACSLPAIVSDRVGCGPDLVQPGVTGLTFPFGDVEALAGALATMAGARAEATAMGQRARSTISRYSVENAAAGTLEAIRYVASAGAASSGAGA